MGLTRQYLRYAAGGDPFGIITSANGPAIFVTISGVSDRFMASCASDNVLIWDTKTGEKVRTLKSDILSEVVCITTCRNLLAAGFSDGSILVFDYNTGMKKCTFIGHGASISCLSFDEDGMRLVSGGKDTEIFLWDVVNESGMFRLKGHKHVVTQVRFMSMSDRDVLVSSSRDSFIKFWDLKTQHAFKTLVGHRSEIWSFVLVSHKSWIITGASDSELRVWTMKFNKDINEGDDGHDIRMNVMDTDEDGEDIVAPNEDDDVSYMSITKVGSLIRTSITQLRHMSIDVSERFIVVNGTDNIVETFKIKNEQEIRESLKKKEKRRKKAEPESEDIDLDTIEPTLSDQVSPLTPFRAPSKVKAVDIVCKSDITIHAHRCLLGLTLMNNTLQVYGNGITNDLKMDEGDDEAAMRRLKRKEAKNLLVFDLVTEVSNEGHRSDIRTINFSSDNYFLLTGSGEGVKIWSRVTLKCIGSLGDSTGHYSLCSTFGPGDKNALIGTKSGHVLIYDIPNSKLLEQVVVSETSEPIWAIDQFPNRKGVVTGSEDKMVKFWDYELVQDDPNSPKRLSISHTRTLEVEDGVLSIKISPNFKFIAVSLLDMTVKVFFFDSLKFFLNLYGHKLPVLTMDISTDGTIIATGSSDKNIKLWGLDFGDCHKSIFAHTDTITRVQFAPNTHHLFSCSKDGTVKQWDCDNFEKITTLKGHQSSVWTMAISPNGKFVASVGHDRTIRLWEKTSEPLILEEEQEMEREEALDADAFREDEAVIAGDTNKETALAAKKTTQTVKATEVIMEAIDLHKSELMALEMHHQAMARAKAAKTPAPKYEPNLLMMKYRTECPDRFMLETLRSIRSSDLEEALLCLPMSYVTDLLTILNRLLGKNWEFELINRSISFLMRIHFGQISSNAKLLPTIDSISRLSLERCTQFKDIIGYNMAALRFLQDKINEREEVALFKETYDKMKEKKGKKKSHSGVAVLKVT